MGTHTEKKTPAQGSFDLGDPVRTVDPDTLAGVKRTIPGGNSHRWRDRVLDDESLEQLEYTHTVPAQRYVYCLDDRPSEQVRPTLTEDTMYLLDTGRKLKVQGMEEKRPAFILIRDSTTIDRGTPVLSLKGSIVVTAHAQRVQSESAPSTK